MVDVIDEVKENLEEGAEAVEEVVEEVEDKVKDVAEKIEEEVEEVVVGDELKKAAEAESLVTEETIEEKKKKLLERVEKLKKKVAEGAVSTEELKEKVKGKKKTETLLPLEDYVKAGIYLGTRVVTPEMKKYVYRRRADGLAILNTDTIDELLKEGVEYLSKFDAKDVIVVCKRQAGWKAVEMFSKFTGIRAFTKKYPAGILTNTNLKNFFENELSLIVDSWVDKNALADTLKVRKKVLMICDTNNFPKGADKIIIGNNKSAKSLGLIFYLLTKAYCKTKKLPTEEIPDLETWTGESDEKISAEFGV